MQVLLVVDVQVDQQGQLVSPSADLATAVAAMRRAIAAHPVSETPPTVTLVSAAAVPESVQMQLLTPDSETIVCPLTLNLPETLTFTAQPLYQTCREVADLRQRVAQELDYATGDGDFWLPIVLTARGPLYAEVIGFPASRSESSSESNTTGYLQPIHLSDRWRQPLYRLAQTLLRLLDAVPGAYLLQFGFQNGAVQFDRLFPFPEAPAIASIQVQEPDLFVCHWLCLTQQPILDLTITPPVEYRVFEPDAG